MENKYLLSENKIYNTEQQKAYENISEIQNELNIQNLLKIDYRQKYEEILAKYLTVLEELDNLEKSIEELQKKYKDTNKGEVLNELRMLKIMNQSKIL